MSVEVIIVRHAIAFERDRARWPDDRLRPLTAEGRRKFTRAAAGLAKWQPQVDALLTSPLVRARDTAALLTKVARWPEAVECPELAPSGDAMAVIALLRARRGARLALVGHEPDLSMLVSTCLAGAGTTLSVQLKKGAVVCIDFSKEIRSGAGTLTALLPPRVLRRMR